MERLKNLFNGKDGSETVTSQDGQLKASSASLTDNSSSSSRSQTQDSTAGSNAAALAKSSQAVLEKSSSEEKGNSASISGAVDLGVQPGLAERVEEVGTAVRSSILKVVPLQEGDCLSCKLIGTAICWGAGVFVLASARRGRLHRQGMQKLGFTLFSASFSTGLFLLGAARLFDLSMFQRNSDGSCKSINELLKEDLQNFQSVMSKFESSSSNTRSEKKID